MLQTPSKKIELELEYSFMCLDLDFEATADFFSLSKQSSYYSFRKISLFFPLKISS